MKLSKVQRAALLRVRTAMRFRFDEHRPPKPTREEAEEEQCAARGALPGVVWRELAAMGLIEGAPEYRLRLTAAGLAALAAHEAKR